MLKDWSRNKFPFYTLPPKRKVSSIDQSKDEKVESIYKKFDADALKEIKPICMLWAAEGLVEFEASTIDSREVILTPVETPRKEEVFDEEDAEVEEDEDLNEDESDGIVGASDSEKESDDGFAGASEEEKVTAPPKRKRQGPSEPERNVKKKVSFAKPPPKQAKQQKIQTKLPRFKVGNAKKIKSNTVSAVEDEAYDFSKFF